MDLTSPLRSLIPTLDSAALEVLARTESALSATRIAALSSRGSRAGLTLALDRLATHGLVATEPSSTGRLYRLNREHLLSPMVLAAAAVRRVLLGRLSDRLDALEPQPVHASVFGSVAHGRSGEDSDIDLLLITENDVSDDESWRDSVRRLQADVQAWTGNRLELLVLTMNGLGEAIASGEPIIRELTARPTIHVHGRPWDDLLAAAHASTEIDR